MSACVVCGFEFADNHHMYPKHLGGERSFVVALCPNHHRCAHIVYRMIEAGNSDEAILQFSAERFDLAFHHEMTEWLLVEYRTTQATMDVAYRSVVQWFAGRALGVLDAGHSR